MRNISIVVILALLSLTYSAYTLTVPAVMWMSQKKVTHEDVMTSYKTKKEVIKILDLLPQKR